MSGTDFSFVSNEGLEVLDYVALGFGIVVFAGYELFHYIADRRRMHLTLSSHADLQRVQWAKYVCSHPKNKLNVIQNFRSNLMILTFYIQVVLAAIASILQDAFGVWDNFSAVRSILPLVMLCGAVINFGLTVLAFFYLHFLTQVSDGVSTMRGSSAEDAKTIQEEWNAGIFEENQMEEVTQRTTIVILQQNSHFRGGWRWMNIGIVGTLWTLSPIAFILAVVFLIIHTYYSDFLFDNEDFEDFFDDAVSGKIVFDASSPKTMSTCGGKKKD